MTYIVCPHVLWDKLSSMTTTGRELTSCKRGWERQCNRVPGRRGKRLGEESASLSHGWSLCILFSFLKIREYYPTIFFSYQPWGLSLAPQSINLTSQVFELTWKVMGSRSSHMTASSPAMVTDANLMRPRSLSAPSSHQADLASPAFLWQG